MILKNIYRRDDYINYDIDINAIHRQYNSMYAPFTDRFSEWSVTILTSGDMVYIPAGNNRSRKMFVVTWDYISGADNRDIYTVCDDISKLLSYR